MYDFHIFSIWPENTASRFKKASAIFPISNITSFDYEVDPSKTFAVAVYIEVQVVGLVVVMQ